MVGSRRLFAMVVGLLALGAGLVSAVDGQAAAARSSAAVAWPSGEYVGALIPGSTGGKHALSFTLADHQVTRLRVMPGRGACNLITKAGTAFNNQSQLLSGFPPIALTHGQETFQAVTGVKTAASGQSPGDLVAHKPGGPWAVVPGPEIPLKAAYTPIIKERLVVLSFTISGFLASEEAHLAPAAGSVAGTLSVNYAANSPSGTEGYCGFGGSYSISRVGG